MTWNRAGYSVTGSPANLALMRTVRNSLSRRIALRRPKAEELEAQIEGHPLRTHRWASNNTVFARVGMDYTTVAAQTAKNGEPGRGADCYGKSAEDIVLRVPVGTVVSDLDNGEVIADLASHEQRALLAAAQREHVGVVGRTLDACVPAPVVVAAVTVVLAVGLVAFVLVADEVGKGEPVVTGHEVDCGVRGTAWPTEGVGGSGQGVREPADLMGPAPPEVALHVPERAVPLGPADGEGPDVVAVSSEIPGLGHELRTGQDGIGGDGVEERRAGVEAAIRALAAQHGSARPAAQHEHTTLTRRVAGTHLREHLVGKVPAPALELKSRNGRLSDRDRAALDHFIAD